LGSPLGAPHCQRSGTTLWPAVTANHPVSTQPAISTGGRPTSGTATPQDHDLRLELVGSENFENGEILRRRTLQKGADAAASAPLAAWSLSRNAYAEETFHVAVCDQAINSILVHPVNVPWNPANQIWAWSPPFAQDPNSSTPKNTWAGLTDVKFRDTSRYGWVTLVTAGGGKVGIVDMPGQDPAADLLWSARPYGSPHAIERIPGIGAIVTASSKSSDRVDGYEGYLTVYGPTDPDDPATLLRVQEIRFQRAHGLWYDGSYLWALGAWTLAKYRVNGEGLSTRLEAVWLHTFPTVFNGHDIDTDRSDSAYLLITGGGSVKRVHKVTGAIQAWTPSAVGVKSYARVASGVSFWQKAISASEYWDTKIQFFDSDGSSTFEKTLSGYQHTPKFYRARVSSVAFA
jgi:hypothetical protein